MGNGAFLSLQDPEEEQSEDLNVGTVHGQQQLIRLLVQKLQQETVQRQRLEDQLEDMHQRERARTIELEVC